MKHTLQYYLRSDTFKKVFGSKDSTVAVFQFPNLPIIMWGISTIANKITSGGVQDFFGYLAFGSLFTWALLELTSGVNIFRRVLGAFILVVALLNKVHN